MELLSYSAIVSISDWKYTKSAGIKNQVFLAGLCSYIHYKSSHPTRTKPVLKINFFHVPVI